MAMVQKQILENRKKIEYEFYIQNDNIQCNRFFKYVILNQNANTFYFTFCTLYLSNDLVKKHITRSRILMH